MFACSSSGSEGPSNATDSGSNNTDTNGDAPSACNTLVNSAGSIAIERVASDPPTLTGGTIEDGTYWMTAETLYTGAGGATGVSGSTKTTIQITAGTVQVSSSSTPDTRTTLLTTTGITYHATDTCPGNDLHTYDGTFEANATTLTIAIPSSDPGGTTILETFTKQP